MKLPNFLIVGAMKAGTTTLYRDLSSNTHIYFPTTKEPNHLAQDAIFTEQGLAEYAELFSGARSDQWCGEASTRYTMWPDWPDAARRAEQILGRDIKVLYLVREPVDRIVSQYRHEFSARRIRLDINRAIFSCPALLNYSRYTTQISPWLERFGKRRVRVLVFEDYIYNRKRTVKSVCEFLGVPSHADSILDDRIYNQSSGKPIPRGTLFRVTQMAWYRKIFRPLLNHQTRDMLRQKLLPKAPPSANVLLPETIDYVRRSLGDEIARLQDVLATDRPLWPRWEFSEFRNSA